MQLALAAAVRALEAKNATPAVPVPVAAAAPSSSQMNTAVAAGLAALAMPPTNDQLHKMEVLFCVYGSRSDAALRAVRAVLPFLKRGAAEVILRSERYAGTHSKEQIGSRRGHVKRVSKYHF